jgi:hypothetical protein
MPDLINDSDDEGEDKVNDEVLTGDDDDVYLINYKKAVGYKIYLHTNTDQPERHKYKMKSIRKIYS